MANVTCNVTNCGCHNLSSEDYFTVIRIGQILSLYVLPCIVFPGIILNCISCLVFTSNDLKKLSSSVYVFALLVSDTGVLLGLFFLWLEAVGLKIYHVDGVCQGLVFFTYVFSFLSVWYVVCVTVENYITICHPCKIKVMCTRRRATTTVLCLLVASVLLYAATPFAAEIRYSGERDFGICSHRSDLATFQMLFTYIDSILTLLIPLVAISCMLIGLVMSLMRAVKWRSSMPLLNRMPTPPHRSKKQDKKFSKIPSSKKPPHDAKDTSSSKTKTHKDIDNETPLKLSDKEASHVNSTPSLDVNSCTFDSKNVNAPSMTHSNTTIDYGLHEVKHIPNTEVPSVTDSSLSSCAKGSPATSAHFEAVDLPADIIRTRKKACFIAKHSYSIDTTSERSYRQVNSNTRRAISLQEPKSTKIVPPKVTPRKCSVFRLNNAQARVTRMLFALSVSYVVMNAPSHVTRLYFLIRSPLDRYLNQDSEHLNQCQLTYKEGLIFLVLSYLTYLQNATKFWIFFLFGKNFNKSFKSIFRSRKTSYPLLLYVPK